MQTRHTYKGTVDGVFGIFVDQKPEGIELEKEITFYSPDEGKVFVDKEGNLVDSVVIQDGIDIADYTEIKQPKVETNDSEENQND